MESNGREGRHKSTLWTRQTLTRGSDEAVGSVAILVAADLQCLRVMAKLMDADDRWTLDRK